MARRRPSLQEKLRDEHVEWLNRGGLAQHEKDFSGAPIAAFAANYPRKLHCRAGLWNRRKRVTAED